MLSLRKWINEMPAALLAPAFMAASVTCWAAMNPPTRLKMFPASYAWFRVLNSMTLYTSLIVIALIWSQRLCETPPATARITTTLALFDMLCFISAFAFASSPEDPVAGFVFPCLLPAVVVCVLFYSVALAFEKWATR